MVYINSAGGHAVNVFIIVSGFVITHLILSKRESYFPFIIRRFFRIFPVFLFCTTLSVILIRFYVMIFMPPWGVHLGMKLTMLAEQQHHFPLHALLHLTMLHGVPPQEIVPFSSSTLLAPAWSLSLEWQFYLVAPFLVAPIWKARQSRWVPSLTVIALLAVSAAIRHNPFWHWLLRRFCFFRYDFS